MNPTLVAISVTDQVKNLASKLMRTDWLVDGVVYNLYQRGWKFEFSSKKRALGTCSFYKKTITLSLPLIETNQNLSLWEDTMKHEIAHAIDCHQRGKSDHSEKWKRIGQQVGCTVNVLKSTVTVTSATGKYTLKCNVCDHEIQIHRKRTKASACSNCCKQHNNGFYSDKFKLEVIQNY